MEPSVSEAAVEGDVALHRSRVALLEKPKVSILVSSLGRPYSMRVVLGNLKNAGIPRKDIQLLVTQDGPPQCDLDWGAVEPDVLTLNSVNLGIAKSNNAMLDGAEGEYLAVMDDDIEYGMDWLGELLNTYECLENSSVRPGMGTIFVNRFEKKWFGDPEVVHTSKGPVVVRFSPYLFGVRFLSRKVFEDVGYFCEDYGKYGYEDTDYTERLVAAGYRLFYLPSQRGRNIGEEIPDGPELKAWKQQCVKDYHAKYLANTAYYRTSHNYRRGRNDST